MSLLNILGLKKCTHDKVCLSQGTGYCPDCGEYVETHWYLTRCACCGIKRVAFTKGDCVMPKELYCANCGEKEYYLEELEKVNFININYATAIKITINQVKQNHSQSWINIPEEQKLLCAS